MTDVLFYEKPGCVNNTRQKTMLMALGHRVLARNLLNEPWSAKRLRPFFGSRPINEWFNASAPRIKSGEVLPALMTEAQALAAMIADPLLIRRPLMETPGGRSVGFEPGPLLQELGLFLDSGEDLQTCPKAAMQPCAPAAEEL